jgi:hypothetical protein
MRGAAVVVVPWSLIAVLSAHGGVHATYECPEPSQ